MDEKSRMFKLGYKMRYGGEGVFLCCHPDDRESWTEEIGADIFKTHDCVIYYGVETDSLAETDTELTGDVLKEMRMFVVLLTTRFLTENNPARDIWFDIALENKIPLVLIVVEPDLDEVIQMSGYAEYQHLDRTSKDPTVISYEEKLKKRLDQILIGSEAEEKVHNAFDGRMFLSYRKKDRSKAQRLMRMIHEIPSWADTAIWYDEYLIPGEKWEKEIDSALNKCDMVALAVTSNLLEPNNYVIDYEIPKACENGKDIVPMAVEELSSEKIDKFEGLVTRFKDSLKPVDKFVNCYTDSTEEIEEALKGYVKESAIHGNRTPEHDYLIGLAYLNGIDMERNTDTAVKRITASAERGLPDAMEKLADMYQTGDGVERDYEEAAKWWEKLINVRMRAYETSGSEEDGKEVVRVCNLCNNVLLTVRPQLLDVIGRNGIRTSEELMDRFSLDENHLLVGHSYRIYGDQARSMDDYSEAISGYEKAQFIYHCLNLKDEAEFCTRMVSLCANLKKGSDERKEWKQELLSSDYYFWEWRVGYLEYNVKKNPSEENREKLIVCYRYLGLEAYRKNKFYSTEKWYMKALKTVEMCDPEYNTKLYMQSVGWYLRNICGICEVIGRAKEHQGDIQNAYKWYEKEVNIWETDAPKKMTDREYGTLAKSYYSLGRISYKLKNLASAKNWFKKAIKIYKLLDKNDMALKNCYKYLENISNQKIHI